MAVRLITPDAVDAPGGVSQYWTRMVRAARALNLTIEWRTPSNWRDGANPDDLFIVVNQDARTIPQPFKVVAVMHSSAMENGLRNGSEGMIQMGCDQWESALRPNTFWVAVSPCTAHDCLHHMGIHADRIINVGCNTDALYPSERQVRRDVARPVVMHHAVDPNKGSGVIDAVSRELAGTFDFKPLSCPPAQIGDTLRQADIFLCIAKDEGGPIVVAEAMCAGLVTVSANVGFVWTACGGAPLQSRRKGMVAWLNREAGIVAFDWKLCDRPEIVADFVRAAWRERALLDPRPYALQHFTLPVFGQRWIEALHAAAHKLGGRL